MSAEILNVTAEVVRNASLVSKLKTVAQAHPIAAAAAGAVTVGLAGFGAFSLGRKMWKGKKKPVVVVKPVVTPAEPSATV